MQSKKTEAKAQKSRDLKKAAQIIHLDVGGEKMITNYGTLVNEFPESKLATHFRDRNTVVGITHIYDEGLKEPISLCTGTHFIDADPRIFRFVLNLLRRPLLYSEYIKVPPYGVSRVEWTLELYSWTIKSEFYDSAEHDRIYCEEKKKRRKGYYSTSSDEF